MMDKFEALKFILLSENKFLASKELCLKLATEVINSRQEFYDSRELLMKAKASDLSCWAED